MKCGFYDLPYKWWVRIADSTLWEVVGYNFLDGHIKLQRFLGLKRAFFVAEKFLKREFTGVNVDKWNEKKKERCLEIYNAECKGTMITIEIARGMVSKVNGWKGPITILDHDRSESEHPAVDIYQAGK